MKQTPVATKPIAENPFEVVARHAEECGMKVLASEIRWLSVQKVTKKPQNPYIKNDSQISSASGTIKPCP